MPDFSGPIQSLELASWLWLILLFPFGAALYNALVSSGAAGAALDRLRSGRAESRKPASAASSAKVAIAGLAGSLAMAIYGAVTIAGLPPGERYLLCHLWRLVRVGQLDVSLDLAMDPLASTLALVVTLLATIVALFASAKDEVSSDEHAWRFFAWTGTFAGSMLTALLVDNLMLVLFAFQAVGLAALCLARTSGSAVSEGETNRAWIVQRCGDGAILLGTAIVFWGLGGSPLADGGYQPDLDPRIVAVSVTSDDTPLTTDDPALRGGAATVGKGFLTVTGLPGSLVYADDSRVPLLDAGGLPLRTPFVRHEMSGGVHFFRIAPDDSFRHEDHGSKVTFVVEGGALPNYTVPRIAMGGDREVALSVIGPTLRFREMRDALLLVDAKHAHPRREALASRRLAASGQPLGGLGLVTAACLLFLIGALTKSAQLPIHRWLFAASSGTSAGFGLLHGGGMLLLGGYLIARLSFLFTLSTSASTAVALVGILTALAGAFACVFQYDLKRALTFSSISQLGLAFVALGSHLWWVGVLQLVTHAVAKVGLMVSVASASDAVALEDLRGSGGFARKAPRAALAYGIGCVAITAVPVPFLSGFWPLTGTASGLLGTAALGETLYVLLAMVAGLTSFGLWRTYYLVFCGEPKGTVGKKKGSNARRKASAALTVSVSLLAFLSAVSGIVLGASGSDVGATGRSVLEAWLSPVFGATAGNDAGFITHLGAVGIVIAVAFAGWALARHRYGDGRRPDWVNVEATLPGYGLGARSR